MKKILEVLQYGEADIRFNTDIEIMKRPELASEIAAWTLFAMVTKLWGGNEQSVIAMIRALAIADIAASINPDEMAEMLLEAGKDLRCCLDDANRMAHENGIKIVTFNPLVKPSSKSS